MHLTNPADQIRQNMLSCLKALARPLNLLLDYLKRFQTKTQPSTTHHTMDPNDTPEHVDPDNADVQPGIRKARWLGLVFTFFRLRKGDVTVGQELGSARSSTGNVAGHDLGSVRSITGNVAGQDPGSARNSIGNLSGKTLIDFEGRASVYALDSLQIWSA